MDDVDIYLLGLVVDQDRLYQFAHGVHIWTMILSITWVIQADCTHDLVHQSLVPSVTSSVLQSDELVFDYYVPYW